jgi:hypothetical protein
MKIHFFHLVNFLIIIILGITILNIIKLNTEPVSSTGRKLQANNQLEGWYKVKYFKSVDCSDANPIAVQAEFSKGCFKAPSYVKSYSSYSYSNVSPGYYKFFLTVFYNLNMKN